MAQEIEDPAWSTCAPQNRLCTTADVLLARYRRERANRWVLGRVARTTLSNPNNVTGTSQVLGTGFTLIGTPVRKVGRTTGETSGTVTDICANFFGVTTGGAFSVDLICMEAATAQTQGGDSGGPVFSVAGTTLSPAGVISARRSNGGTIYSPITAVLDKLSNNGARAIRIQ